MLIVLVLSLPVFYVAMVYGPIAAWLVEMFPTHIRYTSMRLPDHIGNIYSGRWYPVIIASMTFVIGSLFVRETKHVDITI